MPVQMQYEPNDICVLRSVRQSRLTFAARSRAT